MHGRHKAGVGQPEEVFVQLNTLPVGWTVIVMVSRREQESRCVGSRKEDSVPQILLSQYRSSIKRDGGKNRKEKLFSISS